MKRTLILSVIAAVITSCSSLKNGTGTDTITLTGEITPLGMTTFQYGTHSIKAENKLYALKSEKVNLDDLTNRAVTLKGKRVSGYPLEGGPELLDVSEVSVILRTRLAPTATVLSKDSIMLSFTVINDSDNVLRFCKWETPFDPGIGKYIDITDAQGTEPPFIGAMARRVMPPPAESYIEVPPHDSVRTTFNLADSFSIQPGQYTATYSGGGISGLDAGNPIKITVTN